VADMAGLDRYPFSGHSALMGLQGRPWQDTDYVLSLFSKRKSTARRRYREFVEKAAGEGQRPELVGGGLIRSQGGWQPVKLLRKMGQCIKGDERILGDSGFVSEVLTASQDELERKAEYRQKGYNFKWLVARVASLLEMDIDEVLTAGRYPQTVKARSILLYWAHRELGISTVDLAKRVNLSQPSVSQSIKRGEKLIMEKGYKLLPKS
jgi:putative transposase